MYACSPRRSRVWMGKEDFRVLAESLSRFFSEFYPKRLSRRILGVNYGFHLTGGEPFLNFDLLLEYTRIASELGLPSRFVETNCFWCSSEGKAKERFTELKEAGLDGVLISANPFLLEHIPFHRIKLGFKVAVEVFGLENVIVYHPYFYRQAEELRLEGTLKFEEYLERAVNMGVRVNDILNPYVILPMGRACYRLREFYRSYPARRFASEKCLEELTRPWHIHVDCYCNYIPGYCAGLTLGDARRMEEVVGGVDLSDRPVLKALSEGLGSLYKLAVEGYGYKEKAEGYISKCHLCLDIRRYLALEVGGFRELHPIEFYRYL